MRSKPTDSAWGWMGAGAGEGLADAAVEDGCEKSAAALAGVEWWEQPQASAAATQSPKPEIRMKLASMGKGTTRPGVRFMERLMEGRRVADLGSGRLPGDLGWGFRR